MYYYITTHHTVSWNPAPFLPAGLILMVSGQPSWLCQLHHRRQILFTVCSSPCSCHAFGQYFVFLADYLVIYLVLPLFSFTRKFSM